MATPITLKVFRGSELVRSEQFNREIIKIGRLASAHLVLDDDRISRIHSVIEVAPDGAISIIDMSRAALQLGDQITLGGLRIVLQDDGLGGNQAVPEPVNRAVTPPLPLPRPV